MPFLHAIWSLHKLASTRTCFKKLAPGLTARDEPGFLALRLVKIALSAPLQYRMIWCVTGCSTMTDIRFRFESNGNTCSVRSVT